MDDLRPETLYINPDHIRAIRLYRVASDVLHELKRRGKDVDEDIEEIEDENENPKMCCVIFGDSKNCAIIVEGTLEEVMAKIQSSRGGLDL